jgi:phosphoglycolate phosphatase-like HAD superfamily hydrolase
MLKLNQYSHAFFDCDGVILDSNKIKSAAFAQALQGEEQKLIDEFLHYHQLNGGISRFVKFEYFFKIIKVQKNYQKDLEKALKNYSQLSYQGLLACEEIIGVRKILSHLKANNITSFVISGGEQEEVSKVLDRRNLKPYFAGIFGSPTNKKQHLNDISKAGTITKGIYFGDAKSDYEAASAFNLDFVYISGASEWQDGIRFCEKLNIPLYNNFSNFYYV